MKSFQAVEDHQLPPSNGRTYRQRTSCLGPTGPDKIIHPPTGGPTLRAKVNADSLIADRITDRFRIESRDAMLIQNSNNSRSSNYFN